MVDIFMDISEFPFSTPSLDGAKGFLKFSYLFTSSKKKSFLHYYCCRYQWNGSPLLISQPKDGKLAVENCSSCGGTLVFELQLVPPILQFLRFPGQSGQIIYLHFLITMLITTIFYTFCMVMSIHTHRCK